MAIEAAVDTYEEVDLDWKITIEIFKTYNTENTSQLATALQSAYSKHL